ncbi:tetraspanin-7-like [Dreissena polymorpha]|uniref:tetraspanin-7-like n=1 Tax=Dreissena polymorpha TaxID=45954 RepID=UPI002264333A|nr:tetraspanin-7-like [Dreissena polymorpha]XP_052263625.1 tetraspanin-7-like [Dreissena polymorpha]
MDCFGRLAKCSLKFFNIIFMVSGIGVILVGSYAKYQIDYSYMKHILDPEVNTGYDSACMVLIIFGVVVLLIAVFGFLTACLPERCSYGKKFFGGLYIFFLSLLLIGELGGGITAAVFKGKIDDQLPDILKKSLGSHYKPGLNLQAKAWDYVQVWLTCCGSKGPQDYYGSHFNDTNQHVPDTCCVMTNNDPELPHVKNSTECQLEAYQIQHNATSTSDFIKKEGCYTSFDSQIKSHVALLVGVGVGIAMLELLGILLACYLIRKGHDNYDDDDDDDHNNDDDNDPRGLDADDESTNNNDDDNDTRDRVCTNETLNCVGCI